VKPQDNDDDCDAFDDSGFDGVADSGCVDIICSFHLISSFILKKQLSKATVYKVHTHKLWIQQNAMAYFTMHASDNCDIVIAYITHDGLVA